MKYGFYLPFSGGFDSTYELLEIIKEAEQKNIHTEDYDIHLLSIMPTFTYNKHGRESDARDGVLKYIQDRYPEVNIICESVLLNTTNFSIHYSGGMPLQPIYANLAALQVDVNKYDKIEVIFSFITGDQICAYQDEIESITMNTIKLVNLSKTKKEIEKKARVTFPLVTKWKEKILHDMIMNHPKLVDICTTCEGASIGEDNCGNCVPCDCLRSSLINLYIDRKEPEIVRDTAYRLLKERFMKTDVDERESEKIVVDLMTLESKEYKFFQKKKTKNGTIGYFFKPIKEGK